MQTEGHTVKKTINRYRSFRYALILEGIVIGAISGAIVVFFRYLLSYADGLLHSVLNYGKAHTWFIPVWFLILAAAAFVVALLLKWEAFISGSGIPQVEGEMNGELDPCWWKVLAAKLAGGLLSLGCGLSLGREGPSIQLGAMAAKGFSRLAGRAKTEEKLLITCGASAGLSAAFNAPIAGVLFSLEEIHKHFSPEVLLSTMASSITADFVSRNVFGLRPVFDFQVTRMIPLHIYGHVILLGVVMGGLGIVYNTCLSGTQDLYRKIPSQTVRLMVPFLLAGVFGIFYPYVLGGGHTLVEALASGEMMFGALCLLLVLKFGFSMLSFGSGAPGGIFLPLLVLGAVIGNIYYSAAGMVSGSLDGLLGNFIILGMAGYFSAIVRAPITGIILISEMTGSFSHLLTLSMVSLAAYVVPDLVHCAPVYDQLLHRLLSRLNPDKMSYLTGEKVLVEGMIFHGSEAEGRKVSEIQWPGTCLLVSLMRGEAEFVPGGETKLAAGDKIVVLCDETAQGKLHRVLQDVCETVRMGPGA
ncbi:ClC family H(+)/Cl(-) exchange transporter [Clostridium sp. Marseille-P2415]|uniref:ClC family H(+)/Cl(-) exchange transporter n=1 Tax=Clostridium sp. Marseille-P2415 TaxID=1805471 RepID=UPI0009887C40|nr:ClC family H(+)/Cl(-) exchange transporter [Clostridium sp. Marseille-P2415]